MNQRRGFTIVELLIVIVIVAVLATVTVVSYNGVQQRAILAADTQDLATLTKALTLYKADGGDTINGVAGAGGMWYGYSNTVYEGTTKSMRQVLVDGKYLPSSFDRTFMLATCADYISIRTRVILLKTTAKTSPVSEQISPTVCTGSIFIGYTNPNGIYGMNLARAIH